MAAPVIASRFLFCVAQILLARPQHLDPTMIGHPEGVIFETVHDDGKPSVIIKTGPVAERAMRGMRYAIAAMAYQGNNLIVDDVMLDRAEQEQYRKLLLLE